MLFEIKFKIRLPEQEIGIEHFTRAKEKATEHVRGELGEDFDEGQMKFLPSVLHGSIALLNQTYTIPLSYEAANQYLVFMYKHSIFVDDIPMKVLDEVIEENLVLDIDGHTIIEAYYQYEVDQSALLKKWYEAGMPVGDWKQELGFRVERNRQLEEARKFPGGR